MAVASVPAPVVPGMPEGSPQPRLRAGRSVVPGLQRRWLPLPGRRHRGGRRNPLPRVETFPGCRRGEVCGDRRPCRRHCATPDPTRSRRPGTCLEDSGPVFSLAASRDASTIAACGGKKITIWRCQEGTPRPITVAEGLDIRWASVSPDGDLVLTGGEDRTARLWDAASGKLLHELRHDDAVRCGAFGGQGELVATGCRDGSVELWETAGGKPLGFRVRTEQSIEAIALSPDGKFVLTGSIDRRPRTWLTATREPIGSPLLHSAKVTAVAISPDCTRLMTGDGRSARLWSLPPPDGIVLRAPGQGWVRSLAFSPDGKTLLTGDGEPGEGGIGRLWDAFTGELLGSPLAQKDFILKAAFSPNNETIATAGADGTIRLADARTGRPGPVLQHTGPIYALEFDANGSLLLAGGEDRKVRLWDAKTGRLAGESPGHAGAVMAAGFSPSGDSFFTGSHDGSLSLWRTADMAPLLTRAQIKPILAGLFNHDGTRIAVAAENEVLLFDVSSGRFLDPPLNHPNRVRSVVFSPDDRVVLVAGDDGSPALGR